MRLKIISDGKETSIVNEATNEIVKGIYRFEVSQTVRGVVDGKIWVRSVVVDVAAEFSVVPTAVTRRHETCINCGGEMKSINMQSSTNLDNDWRCVNCGHLASFDKQEQGDPCKNTQP